MEISKIRPPSWYPLQQVKGELSLGELLEIAKKRIDFLVSWKAGEIPDDSLDYLKNNALGNLALCIASAVTDDAYFRNWLLETEADFFATMFKKASPSAKLGILNKVFGGIIVGLSGVSEYLNVSSDFILNELATIRRVKKESFNQLVGTFEGFSVAAARFEKAYKIIRKESGLLLGGWVVAPLIEFFRIVKACFQSIMEQRIREIRKRIMGGNKKEVYEGYAQEVIAYWRGKRAKFVTAKSYVSSGSKLWQRPHLFPPCSRILYDKFMATGYIPHGERVQLALFLKGLGMPLEEQLKFWYKAVDNMGISWDNYLRKGGYYIRHIYGLEGSRKDYSPPKCETIISRYFCPFSKLDSSSLREVLKKINPKITSGALDRIIDACIIHEFTRACTMFLESITGKTLRRGFISHPLQFVRILSIYEKKKGGGNKRAKVP